MDYSIKETLLYVDNVELGYGEGAEYKAVLKNINLIEKDAVREGYTTGQVIAILGRSGRGKSTLFKALTGLVKPHSGSILISAMDSNDPSKAKEIKEGDVGFVDQKYTLFRHKTIMDTLNYALRKTKKTREEKIDLINNYLEVWGLIPHKDKYPCELSGGQRQRVAIIEQLLSSGHFMVLDEPFSGLDVGNVREVKNSFKLIQETDDLNTIIFSTHELRLAVELADSIYIVGHPSPDADFSTIVKHYDLKQMGLAWKEFGQGHLDLIKEIDKVMMNS